MTLEHKIKRTFHGGRWLLLAGCLLLWPGLGAWGAASDPEPVREEEPLDDIDLLNMNVETVVTSMRRKQDIQDMPYAVTVLTAEDIRRSGARSVPDALRLVPGVDVADGPYGISDAAPRGYWADLSSQTLVLVDGRQIMDSYMSGTFWGTWPFQLEDIERIEVIRGPAGVIWGANATNGLINIVTKDPADQKGLTTVNRAGSRGLNKEYLGYGLTDGKLRMRVSGEYEGCDGWNEGGNILQKLDDDYKSGRFGLYGIYEKNPRDTVTFSGGSAVCDGVYPPPPIFGLRLQNPGTRANYLMGRWDHKVNDENSYQVTGYVNDYGCDAGGHFTEYQYQQFALQFSHTYKPAENHTLIWGIDTRSELLDTSNSSPRLTNPDFVSTANFGLYLEDEWRFAPKWALTSGGRIDYECYGGFEPSARIALSYKPDSKSMVYGAVSHAFQMPPLGGRFYQVPLIQGPLGFTWLEQTSDRDADACKLLAYELGYRRKFFNRLETKTNLYWHEYRDTWGVRPKFGFPPRLFTFETGNVGPYSTYGVEFESHFKITPKLTLSGNYTFEMLDWRAKEDFNVVAQTGTSPKHKFMIGPRYDVTKNLHLSSNLYFVDHIVATNPALPNLGKMGIDEYFRWDLRAEYEFWKKRAAVAVGVTNLLDPHHYELTSNYVNNAEVNRMIYAEFRMNFK